MDEAQGLPNVTRDRRLLAVLAAAALAAACESDTDTAAVEGEDESGGPPLNVAFVERFEEPLDRSFWIISDGWDNGDWLDTFWVDDQTVVGPEGLAITLAPAENPEELGKPYASGEIRTLGRYDSGYFEIVMKVPRGDGLVTGFFTYTGAPFDDPHDEIDIEILGKDTTEGMFTIFTSGVAKTTYVPLGFDAAEDFHTYGFEWTAEHVRWYVDGELLHEELAADTPLPVTPQIYYLNLWNSSTLSDWLGELDTSAIPQTLDVTCMAAAPAYTGESLCR